MLSLSVALPARTNNNRSLQSLSMLIRDYQQSYAGAWHTLVKVCLPSNLTMLSWTPRPTLHTCETQTSSPLIQIYVGFPFSHEVFSSVRAQASVDCMLITRRLCRRPSSGECCDCAWTHTRGTWLVTRGIMQNIPSPKRAHTHSWHRSSTLLRKISRHFATSSSRVFRDSYLSDPRCAPAQLHRHWPTP